MSESRHQQIMKTFGQRLKKARVAAGYSSAQQFAGILGIEPHAYRKYERGQSEANYDTLIRICELLEISTNELLPTVHSKRRSKGTDTPHPRAA